MPEIKIIDLGGVNCYLIKTNLGFILIDTGGCMMFNINLSVIRSKLEKALENAGCIPGNLKLILVTHGDGDHTGNCAYLREKYQSKIALHKNDLKLVESLDWEGWTQSSKFRSLILKIMFKLMLVCNGSKLRKMVSEFERFTPDLLIDEGFEFSEYGFDAKVLHIPGHTKGSIGILTPDGDFFSGDTFSNMGKPSIALNACDFEELASSVARLKQLKIKTVYPGHGKPFPPDALSLKQS